MRVRSFFSVKKGKRDVRISLQGGSRAVFCSTSPRCTRMFRSVCQKNACSFEPVKLSFRGFESRRAPKAYRQWFGFVLRDARRRYTEDSFRVRERFILRFVIIRQREKRLGVSFGAMQKHALPENGYRVIPIGAKRVLSAPCRKYLSFQPLLLHE